MRCNPVVTQFDSASSHRPRGLRELLTTLGLVTLLLSTTLYLASTSVVRSVHASTSYTGNAKPLTFYFHYLDVPVNVAGLQTKYIMNSTQSFRFPTQSDAHANSFYKPIGLPKIVVDFYLHPNLAGPVMIDGLWQVFLWVNSSAYKPVTFNLQFKEVAVGGVELWDSGQINPTVTSTYGSYLDVPVSSYNLSTPLTHTLSADTTLLVSVDVNAGSSADIRIWYDSPLYPGKAILPARDYARPVDVATYAYDNSETDLFFYNWSQHQRIVIVRANVIDPFGGYDIHQVNLTILDPASQPVVANTSMRHLLEGQWELRFTQTFDGNWSYPATAQLGNYTVIVSVVDNTGYYHQLETGSYVPFVEYATHQFTIGILVYYDPAIRVVDDTAVPLPNAQVYITWPNGSRDIVPRYASANGFINLTHVLAGNYSFTILWKDRVVNQTTMHIDSNGPFTITTNVYPLVVTVVETSGAPLHGAYVMIYTSTGVGYGLSSTDVGGQAIFKLPVGMYRVEAHYSTVYWLSPITTSAVEPSVAITTSEESVTITFLDLPPPIWTTTGFLFLILAVIVVVGGAVYVLYKKGRITK